MQPALYQALRCQIVATFLVFAVCQFGIPITLEALPLAAFQGLLASFLALLWKSDRWWPPIHLVFTPSIVLAAQLRLPPSLYALGFLVLLGLYWTSFRTRVPLFLSNIATVHRLAAHLHESSNTSVLDIGSGTGTFVVRLATLRPDWRIHGVELAPIPFLISRYRVRQLANASIARQDFWQISLNGYEVVYAFLSPAPMLALWDKAKHEMAPGSLLVSNSFPIPGIAAENVIKVGDRRNTCLYCYRIPHSPKATKGSTVGHGLRGSRAHRDNGLDTSEKS